MASNNNYKMNFLSLVENEFERSYQSDLHGTHIMGLQNTNNIDHLGLQNSNFSMEYFSGGPNQGVHFFGFDQPAAGHQINNNSGAINPQHNYNVASSSTSSALNPQYLQQCSSESPSTVNIDINGSNNYNNSHNQLKAIDLLIAVSMSTEENKAKIADIASEAMEELRAIAMVPGEPLWLLDLDKNIQTINPIEYLREFANMSVTFLELHKLIKVKYEAVPRMWPNSAFTAYYDPNDDFLESLTEGLFRTDQESPEDNLSSEASREIGYIGMRPEALVELLMDLEQWSQVFSDIVSKPTLIGVLATNGVKGHYEGTLQVMKVEYYFPSPVVPTRESYIARFCKRINHGMWGVVDVSLERVLSFPSAEQFRRRPSGCLIEAMPDGTSKVIWVEHVTVDNRQVHGIFHPMVSCGFAFSAKRWIETLARQCHRSSSPMASNNPFVDALLLTEAGRRGIMKLSERMVRSFGVDISASTKNKWTTLLPNMSTAQDPRLMAIKPCGDDIGKPPGTSIVFATSLGLPTTPPKQLFDYLRDEKNRLVWDVMSFGQYSVEELAQFSTGDRPGNCISLIQVKSRPDYIAALYLQESYTDSTGLYLVYAPLEVVATAMLLNGGNPDLVAILPSGFIIHPDVSKMNGGVGSGSLLTVAFHSIDLKATPQYVPPQSVAAMNNILAQTVNSIKNAVAPNCM